MADNKEFRNEFLKDGKNVIVSKKMKEIRLSRGMTQVDVAKELHIDRSVYAKYESGKLTPTQERIQEFAAIFGVDTSELEKSVSAVVPDTSALLKNKRLLTMLLEDFDQVIIPDTVLEELDYQKDKGRNKKIAWQVMMTIDEYRTRFRERLIFERSSHFKLNRNDAKIVELAESLNKKLNKVVYLIHDDVRMSLTYDNSILLRDYMAKRSNITNYASFLALDEEYEHLETFQRMMTDIDLNMYLPDGMTLIISCIRCNDEEKRTERGGFYVSETKQYRKLKFLIENDADFDKTDNSRYCLTPLAHCVQLGNFKLFRLLLEMGADYNKGSVDETTPSHLKLQNINEGNTPLMIACWHANFKFVKELCQLPDISLNQQDSNGYTALIKCAVQRYNRIKEGKKVDYLESIYRFLLTLDKVDTLIRDRQNRTANDWWILGDELRKEMEQND
ncbi:MAG: ankyrin repeat domain-containing protein [Oscillospiraceae bacterium]|nr:ankyrin repeat domain-containing protein [Oscillospiraceae bacterium]